MSLATLTASESDFEYWSVMTRAASNPKYSTATGPEQIERSRALSFMLTDLQIALEVLPSDTDDMEYLDELVDLQASLLRKALAMKQTALVLGDGDGLGPDTRNYVIWKKVSDGYDRYKQGFHGLRVRRGIIRAEVLRTLR